MPGQIIIRRRRAAATVAPGVDFAMLVMGCAAVDATPGVVSPLYGDPLVLAADYGLGDGVDAAGHALLRSNGNPGPPALCFFRLPATTPGAMSSVTTSMVGTAVPTAHSGAAPLGTYQVRVEVADDGNSGAGGILGVAGIILRARVGIGGPWLPTRALGTATTFSVLLADGSDTGVQFDLAPSTTNAAYVALAVELRADTLAHLANVTAHDGADTSAAQVLLAASSAPGTVSASTAVVNLVLNALVSHVTNITAHDGPDLVAYTALALLSAATNAKTGIDLAVALKGIINTHEGVSLVAAGAGLLGSTASIASPTTYTAAADFLSGGVTAMNTQPRRPEFVVSGGGTPANMADSVTITGFDYALNAQTETALSLTGLGTVKATKAFRGTGLSCAFVAADGTAATFTIGYSNGVHNSADSTNLVTSADPTYGTLFTNDYWTCLTTPPAPAIGDIYTAGSPATGAFQAVLQSAFNFGLIVIEPPVIASDIATIKSALTYIVGQKADRRPTVLVRFRDQGAAESDSAYIAAGQTFRAACADDERICAVAGGGWLTDAIRDHVYLRSGLPAVLADIQGMEKNPGARGERVAQHPGITARGPLERFSIVDTAGNPVGHDERVRGGLDGPLAGKGGFLTFYHESSDSIAGTYVSEAPVLYGTGATVVTLMDNRVSSGIERVLYLVSFLALQGAAVTNTVGSVTTLDDDARHAMAAEAMRQVRVLYSNEIANPNDPNLVEVIGPVTVSGSTITVTWYVHNKLFLYIDDEDITIGNERP